MDRIFKALSQNTILSPFHSFMQNNVIGRFHHKICACFIKKHHLALTEVISMFNLARISEIFTYSKTATAYQPCSFNISSILVQKEDKYTNLIKGHAG